MFSIIYANLIHNYSIFILLKVQSVDLQHPVAAELTNISMHYYKSFAYTPSSQHPE